MTNKTATNGYYKLPNKQWLHFSMNTWYNLKEDTGMDISDYGVALEKGTPTEKALAMAEIIFAAAKAHDQEEDVEITYNIYKVRGWFGEVIGPDEIKGIELALLRNTKAKKQDGKGKKLKG